MCETIDAIRSNATNETVHVTVNITFGCRELFQKSMYGTGNYISLLYAMRLATEVYDNVDFQFVCADAETAKADLILPWLTGWFPGRRSWNTSLSHVPIQDACGNYDKAPVAFMYKEIQRDLRKMAVALVGIPSQAHPSAQFANEFLWPTLANSAMTATITEPTSSSLLSIAQLPILQKDDAPLYPPGSFDLNDAVIHFRCGDLMASNHPSFGFMTFRGYVRHISPEARSIGILTQPFEQSAYSRKEDAGVQTRVRCRIVVSSLMEYIQARYPLATVQIHNDPNETIALTYSRMIMANQTIVGISSFGVFPAIATFGTGYIRRPDYRKAPNMWLIDPPIDKVADNVVLFDEEKRIMARPMKQLWESEGETGVLAWFWDGEAGLKVGSTNI